MSWWTTASRQNFTARAERAVTPEIVKGYAMQQPARGRPKGSKDAGYLPRVTRCQGCGRELTHNWQKKGLVRCPICRKADPKRARRSKAA